MARWAMVQFRQRAGATYGKPLSAYARLLPGSRGRITETGELQLSERTQSWEIRNERVAGSRGRRHPSVDLPGMLLANPKRWTCWTDGVVYNVEAVLEVTGRPVRFLRVVAKFQGEAAQTLVPLRPA